VFSKLLDHEPTKESFDATVSDFIKRVEKRAVEKRIEMDAEEAEAEAGPGGLDPVDVLKSLPPAMRQAFEAQDMETLLEVVESMPQEEAKYHLKRCEESGLWVPNPEAGPPPYRQ